MAPLSLQRTCLSIGIIVWMTFSPSAWAADGVEAKEPQIADSLPKQPDWFLRLPKDDKVVYKGVASFDEAGIGTAQMLYPAPNAVVALAALITHGIINESAKNSQKAKLQETADKILLPYETVLNGYAHRELMQRALEKTSVGGIKLIEPSAKPESGRFIESIPVFSMTQDQSTIILDNAIVVHAETRSANPYQNIVRVVSHARDGTDLADFWTANQGEKLKEESASLLAESLNIALNEMASEPSKDDRPYKTVRYFEGSTEKMERGQIISERCNRTVIKTLRGWLMSVPARPSGAATPAGAQCGDAPSNRT